MPADSLQQDRYRNGQLRQRTPLRAGLRHGVVRTWHRNGQLASEQRFRNGLLHGRCRQWDENGRLLGEFIMQAGTGVQTEWHDNGQVKLEIPTVGGLFCGRSRLWLPNGVLLAERFYLSGKEVTRSQYASAAARNPSLPQFEDILDRNVRPAKASQRAIHAAFVEGLLARKETAEAKVWLATAKRPSLGRFKNLPTAAAFVDRLYSVGAVKVIVPGIYRDQRGNQFADWLLVELPKGKVARAKIRQVCGQIRRRRLGSFEPQRGIGESHIVLSME